MTLRDEVMKIGDDVLVRRLADPGDFYLPALIYEAGRRRLQAAVANIESLLDSSDLDLQQSAVEALGDIGDDRAGPRVLSLLGTSPSDTALRDTAVWVLGLLKYRPAVETLAAMLRDPAPTVRSCAAAALTAIGHRGALPALRFAFEQEENATVRSDLDAANQQLTTRNL